jgi:hypothetical protein
MVAIYVFKEAEKLKSIKMKNTEKNITNTFTR